MDKQITIASWLIRIGLAAVFLYAAISSFQAPQNWIGFFPDFLRDSFPQEILLTGFSIFEIVLAAWLLLGRGLKVASLISAAAVSAMIVFNFGALDIIFRDIAIVFSSLALLALSHKRGLVS